MIAARFSSPGAERPNACMANVATCVVLLACLVFAAGCVHSPSSSYPLGIYSVPEVDLSTVAAAGFNRVAGPANQAYLNAADQEGLMVLAAPGTSAGPSFNPERARRAVTRFDRHPALWAWYWSTNPT